MKKILASRFQQKFVLEEKLLAGKPFNNISISYEIRGALDSDLLRKAWRHVMSAHDSLSASFHEENGRLFMRTEDSCEPVFEEVSFSERENAETFMEEFVKRPFDLRIAPPHRIAVIRLAETHFLFVFVFHHIITDGTTLEPLLPQWARTYNDLVAGRETPTIPADSYTDYMEFEHASLDKKDQAVDLQFWEKLIGDKPLSVAAPTFPAKNKSGFKAFYFELDPVSAEKTKSFARNQKSTFFWAFASAWMALLHRYSSQVDIAVSYPVNLRPGKFSRLLGPFINNLPLTARFDNNNTFSELLDTVTGQRRGVKRHQHCMLADIITHLRTIKKQPGDARLNIAVAETALRTAYPFDLDGLDVQPLEPINVGMANDLLLEYEEQKGLIHCRLAYDGEKFPDWFARQISEHFKTFFTTLVTSPDRPISDLPILEKPEHELLTQRFNDTGCDFPQNQLIHQIFEEKVWQHPQTPAVKDTKEELSCLELNRRANRIAHALIEKGVCPDTPVGLYLERGVDLMAAVLGIHKAGGGYVPLDPSYPPERIAFMIEDANLRFLVAGAGSTLPFEGEIVQVGDANLEKYSTENPQVEIRPDHTAYVIFTSGSTGRPKGVVVEHRNLVNQIFWFENHFILSPGDAILHKTPTSFDASVWELFWWMVAGVPLIMLEPGGEKDPLQIIDAIEKNAVAVAQFVPSLLNAVSDSAEGIDLPKLTSLKHVFCGGEVLTRETIETFSRQFQITPQFHNLYGPTETTIDASWYSCQDVLPEVIPIGRPVDNTQVYILDDAGSPQPMGVAGELYIGGAQVARGYLNRPELSAEKFVPNPFGEGRIYRTGDLARWLPEGNMEFLGRIDQQVKIRGYRIELGEIESLLRAHLSVRDAIVHPFGEDIHKRLCAYIVGDFDPCELRTHLGRELPDYMVPDLFTGIDAIPLAPSGKADRKNLPHPEITPQSVYVAPGTPEEETLCTIFSTILETERAGIADSFFDLGGHSLLATRLVNAVKQAFNADLPLQAVFDQPTPAGILKAIRSMTFSETPPIQRHNFLEAPLSFAQARLWFLDKFEEGSAAFNIPAAVRIQGELDVQILEKALATLIRRHASLRTIFQESAEGEVLQRVIELENFNLPVEHVQEEQIRDILAQESGHRFDLCQGPLYRFKLLQIGSREFILALNIHHIVFDGWSFGIFFQELTQCYEAGLQRTEPTLPDIPAEYTDFSVWQRECLCADKIEEQSTYWKQQLADIPELLGLPTDRPRPDVQTTKGALVPMAIDQAAAASLKKIARDNNATLFMVLETLWAVFLGKYSGTDDVVVGTPLSGRTRPEIEKTTGFFVNTLPLRHDLSGAPTFEELLTQSKKATLEAYAHQDIPFEKLVDELSPQRSTSHAPIFQAMFVLGDASFDSVSLPGLETTPLFPEFDSAKYDLTLSLGEYGQELGGHLEFSSDLFDRATAERMVHHFIQLSRSLTDNPKSRIIDLSLLDAVELDTVVRRFNATGSDFPQDRTLHQLFEDQVEKVPKQIALRHGDTALTFDELSRRANRIAHALIDKGASPESLVGVCLERNVDLVAAVLGILKAGACYVPLDPNYPARRLAWMTEDADLKQIIITSDLTAGLSGDFIILDQADLTTFPDHNPESIVAPANLAYVIYTSGSTGTPKGVAVEHRALVNKIATLPALLGKTVDFPALVTASINFDPFIEQLMLGLAHGQPTILLGDELSDPARFWETIRQYKVQRADLVPAIAVRLFEHYPAEGTSLTQVLLGGEAVPPSLVRLIRSKAEHLQIGNFYGPTEAAIDCIAGFLDPDRTDTVPIGRPMANYQAYILDTNGQPLPVGVPGELCIAGEGLARGYLKRPELTADVFIPNPFGEGRLYKTGDLARWLSSGEIEYLGRIDQQVKIRGFRIELGEIESALREHPTIEDVIVNPFGDEGEQRLCAYIIGDFESTKLRDYLSEKLPDYMVPAFFMKIEAIPLTPSGKADRKNLPHPEVTSVAAYTAPRTETEKILCAIFSEVLGIEQVGIHDNFFEAGGDSILALQIVAKARSRGLNLAVKDIFKAGDVEGLSSRIKARSAAPVAISRAQESSSKPSPEIRQQMHRLYPGLETVLPLTPLQQGILFHSLESEGSYQVQLQFRVEGSFNPERFHHAWQQAVQQHQVLRMTVPEGETSFMAVCGKAQIPYHFEDWRSETDAEEKLKAYAEADRKQGFDLAQAPLLRLAVFRITEGAWEILINNHHITLDGWSLSVVLADVLRFYAGEPPSQPLPFSRYTEWLNTRSTKASLDWWEKALAGFDRPNHIDLAVTEKGEGFGDRTINLNPDVSRKLEQTAREMRSTPSTLLQAIWGILISRLCDNDDIVFGNVVSGRPAELSGVENMVGMFINTVPVRMRTGNRPLREIIREMTEFQGERGEHEYAALHQTQAQAPIPKGSPLFETLFVFENYPVDERLREESGREFVIRDVRGVEAPHYPLSLAVLPGDHYTLQLTFDRERIMIYAGSPDPSSVDLRPCSVPALEKTDTPVSEPLPFSTRRNWTRWCTASTPPAVDFPRRTRPFIDSSRSR